MLPLPCRMWLSTPSCPFHRTTPSLPLFSCPLRCVCSVNLSAVAVSAFVAVRRCRFRSPSPPLLSSLFKVRRRHLRVCGAVRTSRCLFQSGELCSVRSLVPALPRPLWHGSPSPTPLCRSAPPPLLRAAPRRAECGRLSVSFCAFVALTALLMAPPMALLQALLMALLTAPLASLLITLLRAPFSGAAGISAPRAAYCATDFCC